MRLQLLLTGNELMSGHTVDSNSAMFADYLARLGYRIDRKVTLGDSLEALVSELDAISRDCDLLLVNGGLGPTDDDLTAQALALATGTALQQHPQALAHLQDWCVQRKVTLNAANLKQALLPAGAEVLANPVGSAVGFAVQHNGCLIACTPGVPVELEAMLEQSLLPMLRARLPAADFHLTRRWQTFGLGESQIQQTLHNRHPDWPATVEVGFRAGFPLLELKLTVRAKDALKALERCSADLCALIDDHLIGTDNATLQAALVEALQRKNMRLVTAESCTGGLIASKITEVPGASAVFQTGWVTYANDSKQQQLGVSAELLQQHGAVSEETVLAMSRGALQRSGADVAIAVSGIAGPDGGSAEKPVGTVWIALADRASTHSYGLRIKANRLRFQQLTAAIALDLLRRRLCNLPLQPAYLQRYQPD